MIIIFRFTESNLYYAPAVGKVESYRNYIESLPLTDNPEVFGMHENANISYQTQESEKMIQIILNIQPRIVSRYSCIF